MEAKGLLNGTTFNYVVNNDLSKIRWTLSDYKQGDPEQSQCSGCLSGCKKAVADAATICTAAADAKKQTQTTVSLARPFLIIVVIVIWPGGCVLIILVF